MGEEMFEDFWLDWLTSFRRLRFLSQIPSKFPIIETEKALTDESLDELSEDESIDESVDEKFPHCFKEMKNQLFGKNHPKLVITTLTNEPNAESKIHENKSRGLKFRKLNDKQIIVEFNEKTKVEHFTELHNRQELMLYNFKKMEHFCKSDYADGTDKIVSRCYILVKNFNHEEMHVPGKEAQIYSISKDFHPEYVFAFFFKVYANGNQDEHKGYVCINIKNVKDFFNLTTGETVLYISVIDNEGNPRFTQIEIFHQERDAICGTGMINNDLTLCKFITRETIRCNPFDLLHGDDLVLCINIERDRPSHITETETKIERTLKKYGSMHILLLDSDIGKVLCKNSNFFKKKLKKNKKIVCIPEVEKFKNICRLSLGASYIKVNTFEDIYDLYEWSHEYKIVAVIEFCRNVFKKHGLYVANIPLIRKLAESYDDVFLSEILSNSLKFHKKYEIFICDLLNFACVGKESKSDDLRSEHIHYASGEYIECDNLLRNTNHQYCSLTAQYEEVEAKLNFSSVFNSCENEKITLPLGSAFGKCLSEISNVIKDMLEFTCSKSEPFTISQNHLEAFKNIYRLFMGANYIKGTTISDIISLYEVCDYYDISPVMEICRNLFKKHICIRNHQFLLDLSKCCVGDIELEKIVLDFKADYERYVAGIRHPECFKELGYDNFVELDEILGFQHNFNV